MSALTPSQKRQIREAIRKEVLYAPQAKRLADKVLEIAQEDIVTETRVKETRHGEFVSPAREKSDPAGTVRIKVRRARKSKTSARATRRKVAQR